MSEAFLRIAGITLAVRCDDPRVPCRFDEPASRFLVDGGAADVELTVRAVDRIPPPGGRLLFDSGSVWRMYEDGAGVRVDCTSDVFGDTPYKFATFDASFTRGAIGIRAGVFDGAVDPLAYPLDELLMALLLARGRGVELHACGVVDRAGRGHLFVGQSGAGKTTIARLWGDDAADILSDDRVIVRDVQGTLRMFGTPWHGEAELSSPESAPLAGVYLLVQAPANELRLLSGADAVARLFACTFPPFFDARALDHTLSFLAGIAARVPVRELRFTRDRAALGLIV